MIDKPAGWSVHGPSDQTLLARAYLKESGFRPKTDFQPTFMHRLDKETSGLMVLAKTQTALRALNRQLKFKKIHKVYIALLSGEIRPQGSIRWSLQRQFDRKRWLTLMVPVRRGGIYAQTDYRRLELFGYAGEKFSLVQARLRTGRTHQLRAHFAAVGCPIVGDDLYGRAELNEKLRSELGVSRQLLHAKALEFAHPTTEALVRFESSLPEDFQAVLERLRQSSRLGS